MSHGLFCKNNICCVDHMHNIRCVNSVYNEWAGVGSVSCSQFVLMLKGIILSLTINRRCGIGVVLPC
jgi:hypothetical protein